MIRLANMSETLSSKSGKQKTPVQRPGLWRKTSREGFASAGIKLTWTDRLVAAVAAEGYDHRLGARPLQRALERIVVTPLARWKIANPLVRSTTLQVDVDQQQSLIITSA